MGGVGRYSTIAMGDYLRSHVTGSRHPGNHAAAKDHTRSPWLIAGVLPACLLSVGLVALLGLNIYPSNFAFPTFLGACERIKEAGLGPTPDDWFCYLRPQGMTPGPVMSSFLLGLGFALPGVFLALRGRRLTAFLPILAFFLVGFVSPEGEPEVLILRPNLWWPVSFLKGNGGAQLLVATLVLSIPALSVIVFLRPRAEPRDPLGPRSRIIASIPCVTVGGLVIATLWWLGSPYLHGSIIGLAIFGSLMGRDRRWVPWTFILEAILLSQGPSQMLWRFDPGSEWTAFLPALFLFALASICSALQPIARLIELRRPATAPRDWVMIPVTDADLKASGVRGTRILNLVGAAALVAAFGFSTLGVGARAVQPSRTFLGFRGRAQDVVAIRTLRSALDGANAFHLKNGTFRRFEGHARDDRGLVWRRRIAITNLDPRDPPSVSIVATSKKRIALVSVSRSGKTICVAERRGTTTFGMGRQPKAAVRRCGETPWSEVPSPRIPTCDAASDDYILCRMVQVLVVNILEEDRQPS